jgi:acyl carrier protein
VEGAARLVKVMRDVFDVEDLRYDDNLTAGDVKRWDSLRQMVFVSTAEKQFGVHFTSGEVDSFRTAGDVLDAIMARVPQDER